MKYEWQTEPLPGFEDVGVQRLRPLTQIEVARCPGNYPYASLLIAVSATPTLVAQLAARWALRRKRHGR